MRRDIEDALHLKIDPPLAADEISISKTMAESQTLRMPGKRIRGKLQMGDFVKPILPPEAYNVGADHFAFVEKTEDTIKHILGVPDLKALQQARQIPSSDTVSQFFSQAGAIVTAMSRALDPVMKFIAECNRYYFYQFYNMERRIKILGDKGISKEDFDFEPGSLIPKFLPNEPTNEAGIFPSTRFERAKFHLANFRTKIEATSLHQITHMQRKLLLMQATKLFPGYPMVDPGTIAKELDIAGWGDYDGDTIKDKVTNFMQEMVDFQIETQKDTAVMQAMVQVEVQKMMMQMQAQNSPEGQIAGALGQMGDAMGAEVSQNGAQNGMKRGVGRPPEFQDAPSLEHKSGELRSTITS
jgi:hypothetical protein